MEACRLSGVMRLNVSSVDSLEAVYLCISVKGYFRNELCEDVKKRFLYVQYYKKVILKQSGIAIVVDNVLS